MYIKPQISLYINRSVYSKPQISLYINRSVYSKTSDQPVHQQICVLESLRSVCTSTDLCTVKPQISLYITDLCTVKPEISLYINRSVYSKTSDQPVHQQICVQESLRSACTSTDLCLFVLRLNVPVNNFSVITRFLGN